MKLIGMKTLFVCLLLSFGLTGCATKVVESPGEVTRSQTPLGTFTQVVLVKTKIAPEYDGQAANEKAVAKIDELLETNLGTVFSNFSVVTESDLATKGFGNSRNNEVLLIKPYVKQIKFIGGGARFFAGAMAGSSVVIMDTAFVDAATGTVLSNPGFYRKAGAYSDGLGIADNRMLDDVVQDLVSYARTNK